MTCLAFAARAFFEHFLCSMPSETGTFYTRRHMRHIRQDRGFLQLVHFLLRSLALNHAQENICQAQCFILDLPIIRSSIISADACDTAQPSPEMHRLRSCHLLPLTAGRCHPHSWDLHPPVPCLRLQGVLMIRVYIMLCQTLIVKVLLSIPHSPSQCFEALRKAQNFFFRIIKSEARPCCGRCF